MKTIDLKESIGLALKRSAKSWEKAADIELNDRFSLTGGQWKVIVALSIREGITQRELADMMFLEAPTIVPILDKMEKEEFVKRQSDPRDRRNNLIFLTEKSKEMVDPIVDCMVEMREIGLSKISKKDLEIARKTLEQINKNAEEFIVAKGNKADPDVWTVQQNKAKTIVKM